MITFNQYITGLFLLGILLFSSCGDKTDQKEKKFLSDAVGQLDSNKQYEWIVILPGMGCHGCIQEGEYFMKQHISNEKILFVLTNISSLKILQQKTEVIIKDHSNIYIDRNNQFKLLTENSIYPCVIQVDEGKLQQYAFQCPQTSAFAIIEKALE